MPSTTVHESEAGNVRFVSELSSGRQDRLVTFCSISDENLGKTVLFWEGSNGTYRTSADLECGVRSVHPLVLQLRARLHTLDADGFSNDNGNSYLTSVTKTHFWQSYWECFPADEGVSTRIAKNTKVIVVMHWFSLSVPKIVFCLEIYYWDTELCFTFRKYLFNLWLGIFLIPSSVFHTCIH